MESPEDEWNRVKVGFTIWVILIVIIIIIWWFSIRKGNFPRSCAPSESMNWQTGKCEPINWDALRRSTQMSNIDVGSRNAGDYGGTRNSNSHNIPHEELQRIAKYSPQMFNNLPPGMGLKPPS